MHWPWGRSRQTLLSNTAIRGADFLVGLIVFVVLTVRTLLILRFGKIEENTFRGRVTCVVAFLALGERI
jgi:hypothetical protein